MSSENRSAMKTDKDAFIPTDEQLEKYKKLKEFLNSLGSAAVAFSGGVDSAFLLKAAKEALGVKNIIALTAVSGLHPKRELEEAEAFCRAEGIRHIVFEAEEFSIDGFLQNPPDRCYLCKRDLMKKMKALAEKDGMKCVAEGSNLDDEGDYRPGMRAVAEFAVKSPLRCCGFYKSDIRALSRYLGMPTWNKQSFACLASRFVYGETISAEKLEMVDRAEQLLLDLGFSQFRVRIHGKMARIEIVPGEFPKIISEGIRSEINEKFREYGFSYVSLDLSGYRTGSMNETIKEEQTRVSE